MDEGGMRHAAGPGCGDGPAKLSEAAPDLNPRVEPLLVAP